MALRQDVAVRPIPLGMVRAFLVFCGRWLLVDAGMPGTEERIARHMALAGIVPERDLALIVLTHGHTDHMGAAALLRERWKVPIAMHRLDAMAARQGFDRPLRPTGVFGRGVSAASRVMARRPLPTFEADVLLDDATDLSCLGACARVVATPGHTAGSISVITEDGDALVGDLVIGHALLRGRPRLPYVADDPERIRESVRALLALSPRRVHSAHGRPFGVDDLVRWAAAG